MEGWFTAAMEALVWFAPIGLAVILAWDSPDNLSSLGIVLNTFVGMGLFRWAHRWTPPWVRKMGATSDEKNTFILDSFLAVCYGGAGLLVAWGFDPFSRMMASLLVLNGLFFHALIDRYAFAQRQPLKRTPPLGPIFTRGHLAVWVAIIGAVIAGVMVPLEFLKQQRMSSVITIFSGVVVLVFPLVMGLDYLAKKRRWGKVHVEPVPLLKVSLSAGITGLVLLVLAQGVGPDGGNWIAAFTSLYVVGLAANVLGILREEERGVRDYIPIWRNFKASPGDFLQLLGLGPALAVLNYETFMSYRAYPSFLGEWISLSVGAFSMWAWGKQLLLIAA